MGPYARMAFIEIFGPIVPVFSCNVVARFILARRAGRDLFERDSSDYSE